MGQNLLIITYYYHILGNNHPPTSYFRVPSAPGFWFIAICQSSSRDKPHVGFKMERPGHSEAVIHGFRQLLGAGSRAPWHGQRFQWSKIFGYGSISISTMFRVMNIHLPAILRFTRGTRVLTHPHLGLSHSSLLIWDYPMIINHHGKLAAGFAS